MTPIRKRAIAWVLAATAVAVASLAVSFIYLRDQHLNDLTLVESKIQVVADERGFKLEEARKAGYSDSEIAKFLVAADRAEFDQQWLRILLAVSAIYAVIVLGVFASTLLHESKNLTGDS
ncbi:MAG: hypothetical protein Q8O29_14165 [Polaromonas sp.]|uniref:hypothetical protein n=1 Tax=Polaromonas sp. TaxID=1869339 RepID=UPI002735DA15|nr:hypothetical protein [Polaromonas sp.]MDP2819382.1 hypothetical protein [Polaromonas sp.]